MDSKEKSGPNPWIAILISLAAFLVSSTTLYFTHFYSSETLYALLLDFGPYKEISDNPSFEDFEEKGFKADIVLVNSGNQNIIVSNVALSFSTGYFQPWAPTKKIYSKTQIPEFTSPILVGPRHVHQFQIRFAFDRIPRQEIPQLSANDVESYPVSFIFTTIGSSGKLEDGELKTGMVALRNRKYAEHSTEEAYPIKVRN